MPGADSSSLRLVHRVGRRLVAGLRAAACISVIFVVAGVVLLRVASAQVSERLHGFGAELLAWQGARLHSTPRQLSVNGLELRLVTATTDESVGDTLDRFHELCRRRGGLSMPEGLAERMPGLDGTFRRASESEGVLACLDSGGPLTLDEVGARLQQLASTGDLSAAGALRYVFARKSGKRTAVLVLWTEGAAPLLGMFPESGDAPGLDPRHVPRPAKTTRLLSAAEHGAPYSLALYDAEQRAPEELRSWYETALETEGWTVTPSGDADTLLARRGPRTVLIRVARGRAGQTIASVVELS